ncbi:MAG: EAL domain-containing protein [Nevskia sp.]|nr:EAL domain-containing protein [Nevskia sp.]
MRLRLLVGGLVLLVICLAAVAFLGLGGAAGAALALQLWLGGATLLAVLVAYLALGDRSGKPGSGAERSEPAFAAPAVQAPAPPAPTGPDRRMAQLEAALTDNEELRRKMEALSSSQAVAERLFRSTLDTVTDRLIMVSAGCVVEISPFAASFLGLDRTKVVGREFDEVVRLFDLAQDKPEEHRLRGLTRPGESGAPRHEQIETLFMPVIGEPQRVLVSVTPVSGAADEAAAVMVRLEPVLDEAREPLTRPAEGSSSGTDFATGLPGREALGVQLRELMANADATSTVHALLLVAVDNQVQVTDSLGYRAGDELMYGVAQILCDMVGARGTCYRVGGDVLGAMLPRVSAAQAAEIGKRVGVAVSGRTFTCGDIRFESSVSIGVADSTADSVSADSLQEHAHTALAKARFEGNGTSRVYEAGDRIPEQQRRSDREWISWLQRRLGSGHLRLASQDIQPLAEGKDVKPMFEVYARIEDEDGVWVTPRSFLGAVERYQFTGKLDLQVLEAVLGELNRRPDILNRYEFASINMSAASMTDPAFAAEVLQAIALTGVPGHYICIEVDENHALSNQSALRRFMQTVRPAGIRFALDRYRGVGGLYELRELPIDYVKLHESLLQCLDPALADKIGLRHLSWVCELAHMHKAVAVATGVERQEILPLLRTNGVDFAQGVAINKLGPMLV